MRFGYTVLLMALLLQGCSSSLRMTTAVSLDLEPVDFYGVEKVAVSKDVIFERTGIPSRSVAVTEDQTLDLVGAEFAEIKSGEIYYQVLAKDILGTVFCSVSNNVNGKVLFGEEWAVKSCLYDDDQNGAFDHIAYMLDDFVDAAVGVYIITERTKLETELKYVEAEYGHKPEVIGVQFGKTSRGGYYLQEFTRDRSGEIIRVIGAAGSSLIGNLGSDGIALFDETQVGSTFDIAGVKIEVLSLDGDTIGYKLLPSEVSEKDKYIIPRRVVCQGQDTSGGLCQMAKSAFDF